MQTLPKNREELKSMLQYMRTQGANDDELRAAVQEVKTLRPNVSFQATVFEQTSANTKKVKTKVSEFVKPFTESIKTGFKEGEKAGEEMQARRLALPSSSVKPGLSGVLERGTSRALEEVVKPALGAFEGAAAPIAKAGIAAGKAVLNDEQEQYVADAAGNLAQKYENFKSSLSPEARVQFDEIATLANLGGTVAGSAGAVKLATTGAKGVKTGVKTAIASPEFQTGLDTGLAAGQKVRGVALDTATKTVGAIQKKPNLIKSKLIDVSVAKNKSDLSTYLKSKRSLEQAAMFYKQKKNIDIPEYLAETNLFKGIKSVNGSIDPSEAVEALENRANLFMEAKKKTLPIMDKYLPAKNKSELRKTAVQSIKGLLPEADEADLIKLIDRQISALPEELNYQKLDTLRKQFRKAGVDAKGIQRPDSQYKALEEATRNMIFDASDNLPFDTNGELAALNKEIKDALSAKEFLDKTLRGQKIKGGQLGGYVGKTIGAVAGSKLGVLGAIAGSELGGAISRILQNNQLGSQFKFSLIKDITDDPKILKEIENLLGRDVIYQPLALPSPKDNIRVQKGSTKTIKLPKRSQSTIDEAEAIKRAKGIIKTTNRQAIKKK